MAEATAELFSKVDAGEINASVAIGLQRAGADLTQGLAYAVARGRLAAVLTLVSDSGLRFGADTPCPSSSDLLDLANRGEWGTVAYFLAADMDLLPARLKATDTRAREKLQRAAGFVRVQVPQSLRASYAKTCAIAPDLLVEKSRWLLPRPKKEDMFLTAKGKKLEESWYSVVEFPLGDDFKEALLRRKSWSHEHRQEAAQLIKTVGETLLCKAVKAEQWELASWILERGDALELAEQVNSEFVGLWGAVERSAMLRSLGDLKQLLACIDAEGKLKRAWRRGAKAVPAGSTLLSPDMERLKEAMQLESSVSLKTLHKKVSVLTFALPQSNEARKQWRLAASELDVSFARPLLHWTIQARQVELLQSLVNANVDVDICDARGFSALAAAASTNRWRAAEILLDDGFCSADGANGILALAAAQRASRSRSEDAELAESLIDKIRKRQQRTATSALTEYFQRQARGEVMHGIEPRRFKLQGDELRLRSGQFLRLWTRALLVDCGDERKEVVFALLDADTYAATLKAGMLDVANRVLVREELLTDECVAIVVPARRLVQSDCPGKYKVKVEGTGPLTSSLPVLAMATAPGGLSVLSATACCQEAIGRVEVVVDGACLGETPQVGDDERLQLLVPPREMRVVTKMAGRTLKEETVMGGPDAELNVEVGLAIIVYAQVVDDNGNEQVCVAGHRSDVPSEDTRPFKGEVSWDGGRARLRDFSPLVLGAGPCLSKVQSLTFKPELQEGQRWEASEWLDTDCCQFMRLLRVPVKVGNICSGRAESEYTPASDLASSHASESEYTPASEHSSVRTQDPDHESEQETVQDTAQVPDQEVKPDTGASVVE